MSSMSDGTSVPFANRIDRNPIWPLPNDRALVEDRQRQDLRVQGVDVEILHDADDVVLNSVAGEEDGLTDWEVIRFLSTWSPVELAYGCLVQDDVSAIGVSARLEFGTLDELQTERRYQVIVDGHRVDGDFGIAGRTDGRGEILVPDARRDGVRLRDLDHAGQAWT